MSGSQSRRESIVIKPINDDEFIITWISIHHEHELHQPDDVVFSEVKSFP